MHWTAWVVFSLVLMVGGWMLFDGLHALVTGDFVTPKSGTHTGQLGPWASLVSGVGFDPRSMLIKFGFVVYALSYLAAGTAFIARVPGAWWVVIILAVLGLWYLPFGAVANLAVVAFLLVPSLRTLAWVAPAWSVGLLTVSDGRPDRLGRGRKRGDVQRGTSSELYCWAFAGQVPGDR